MRKFSCTPQIYYSRPGAGFVTSLYTFPHDLGVEPFFVRMYVKCLIAEHGYAVGDIILLNSHAADRISIGVPGSHYAVGFTIVMTPTELDLSFDTIQGASIHQFDAK